MDGNIACLGTSDVLPQLSPFWLAPLLTKVRKVLLPVGCEVIQRVANPEGLSPYTSDVLRQPLLRRYLTLQTFMGADRRTTPFL